MGARSLLVLLAASCAPPAAVTAESAQSAQSTATSDGGVWPAERFADWMEAGKRRAALGASEAAWTAFVNQQMHPRIHASFSNEYLASLDAAAKGDPRNDARLWSKVDIVVAADGGLESVTFVNSSGVKAFDDGVNEAVRRAAPFAKPPAATLAPDGKVHVRWSFHRDAGLGCNAAGAEPSAPTF
jgi:TonB family protein